MDEVIPSLPFQAGLKKDEVGKKLQPRGLSGPEPGFTKQTSQVEVSEID